jgi:hypothetical protein
MLYNIAQNYYKLLIVVRFNGSLSGPVFTPMDSWNLFLMEIEAMQVPFQKDTNRSIEREIRMPGSKRNQKRR